MSLPKPPSEVKRQSTLDGLAPKFRASLVQMCDDVFRETGARPLIFETLRTTARQRHIYGFGRTWDDGRGIVTHSRDADESWHWERFGLAADVIHPTLKWDAPSAWWKAVERAAEANALTSGADWDGNDATRETFVDRPHVQWGRLRRSPSPRARRIVDSKGTAALWVEVGAA
jgi:hypothetical protein